MTETENINEKREFDTGSTTNLYPALLKQSYW